MADILEITDADIAPMQPLSSATLFQATVDNLATLALDIYGERLPQVYAAHDHSSNGGEFIKRAIAQWTFEQTGATAGLEILPPFGSADFTVTPKQVYTVGLLLPSGCSDFSVAAVVDKGSIPESFDLQIHLNTFANSGYLPESGRGATVTLNFPSGTSSLQRAEASFNQSTIKERLGDFAESRLVELSILLISNPIASNRLLSLIVFHNYGETVHKTNAEQTLPVSTIPPTSIAENAILFANTTTGIKNVCNGTTQSLVGRVPGFENDGVTLSGDDFRVLASAPHQHQGRIVHDGACLQRGLWFQGFGGNLGKIISSYPATTNDGFTIFDATPEPIDFDGIVSVPEGLKEFDLYACVKGGTFAVNTILDVSAHMTDDLGTPPLLNTPNELLGGNYIAASSGLQNNAVLDNTNQFYKCQNIAPILNDRWLPQLTSSNAFWSFEGLAADVNNPPAGMVEDYYARITTRVRMRMDPKNTERFRLRVRFSLRADGVPDTLARVYWILLFPTFGY